MARFFMYLPFDDKKLTITADLFIDRMNYLIRDKTLSYKSSDWIQTKHLKAAEIEPLDMLYIAGHCDKNVDALYDTEGNSISATGLADRLIEAGLSKYHKVIHLWACYSGFGIAGGSGGLTKGLGTLLYKFWNAMNSRGFYKLTVYGYNFAVMDPLDYKQADLLAYDALDGFKTVMQTPHLLKQLPGIADNWSVGIDPEGSVIPPSPLKRPVALMT